MTQECPQKTEVYSRVCGFFRPVQQWNKGKKQEFADRKPYRIDVENKVAPPQEGGRDGAGRAEASRQGA